MTKDKWIWMPHAAHFICGRFCQFHLATYVGKYIVSTVGEYYPDRSVRKIYAESRGITVMGQGDYWDRDYAEKMGNNGYEEIGSGRLYETMVFKAKKSKNQCCPYVIESGINLDFSGYNDPKSAYKGHLRLCNKWDFR